jgi:hypothetical protein
MNAAIALAGPVAASRSQPLSGTYSNAESPVTA